MKELKVKVPDETWGVSITVLAKSGAFDFGDIIESFAFPPDHNVEIDWENEYKVKMQLRNK